MRWRPITLLCLFWVTAGAAAALGQATPGEVAPPDLAHDMPLGFADCVALALERSPFLAQSSLEIDLKRLDESDSRHNFLPTVSLQTRYYLNQPEDSDDPYTIVFVTDPYNPLEPYFSLRARKVLTRMAVLAHRKAIAQALYRIGQNFLDLAALERVAELDAENAAMAEQSVAYATNRLSAGAVTVLDVRIAEQHSRIARLGIEKAQASKAAVMESLRTLLGAPAEQELRLDLDRVVEQVLGSFDPMAVTLAQARADSMDLTIQELKTELQELHITVAYTELLPTLHFGLQTVDTLSGSDDEGLYFSVGLDLPLWDGLRRNRNIRRQRIILQQYETEKYMKESDLGAEWHAAQDALKDAAIEMELSSAREELAKLRTAQKEAAFESGVATMAEVNGTRRDLLGARKASVMRGLKHDEAVVRLRYLSGDLFNSLVGMEPL